MVRYMIQRLYFIRVYCAMLPKSFVSGIYGFLWITQLNLSIFVDLHSIHPRSSLVRCCVSLSHCELVNCVLFLFFKLLPDSISILVTKKPLLSSKWEHSRRITEQNMFYKTQRAFLLHFVFKSTFVCADLII